tara:strand:- start:940 stop:1149 length:210 start_codon:yes stop_codon:yes gene_type:complete
MQIKRRSSLTGEVNTKEINVTPAQIAAWEGGELAQNAFPDASPSEREFIMTGCTESDWTAMFGEEEDES